MFILTVMLVQGGCRDKIFESFMANSPVYMSYDDLRAAVKKSAARELQNPGKIYFKDNFIFINEKMAGVHVIDNSNPANPKNIAFIEIPGNVDMAIKGSMLYADSYVDLVAIDLSDLTNIREKGRAKDVFPYTLPEYDTTLPLAQVDQTKGVVVGWEKKVVRQELEQRIYPIYYYKEYYNDLAASYSGGIGEVSSGQSFGIGGSMARFGLYENYLYVTNQYNLKIFDITSLNSPVEKGSQYVGWNIETLFVYNKHLFFGTTTGLLIYSLDLPTAPNKVNQYTHITSCDPVVVADNIAYVTLRGGTTCGGTLNELDVLKLSSDYKTISPLAVFPMTSPYGLGIDGDVLFVCEGTAGLRVFDASDPAKVGQRQLKYFTNIIAYDVIPLSNCLFLIGDGGFYTYDYSDLQNIHLIGSIPVRPFFAD